MKINRDLSKIKIMKDLLFSILMNFFFAVRLSGNVIGKMMETQPKIR